MTSENAWYLSWAPHNALSPFMVLTNYYILLFYLLKPMRSIGELDLIIYMHTYMYTCRNIHTNAHTYIHTYTPTTTTTIMTSTLSMGRRIKTLFCVSSMLWVLWCPTLIVWNFSGTTFPWAKCSWNNTIQLDKTIIFDVPCLWFRNQAMAKLSQRWPKCPKCLLCRFSVFWTLRGYKKKFSE